MRRVLLACLACVASLLFCLPAALPAAPAYAASGTYGIDELSTELTVQPNATTRIVERQTITFDDLNTGIVWYLHVPEDGESVRISSVRVAPADHGGALLADWTYLQMIDSNPMQQGRKPGDSASLALRAPGTQPWYSYNIGDGMMRCYFPTEKPAPDTAEDAGAPASSQESYRTFTIEVDYSIRHRVRVYRDVAELYWRYANDSLPSASSDVNLQVQLPVPDSWESGTVAESVRAWGHGPNDGVFSVGADAAVTYHIDRIARGNFAEAHVIFPASWMTDMAPNAANMFTSVRGPSAIAEEDEWVDRSRREEAWDNNVRVLFLAIAIVGLIAGLLGVLRRGRSPLARRSLLRTAAAFGILALAENLFFREPLTTLMLAALAGALLLVALMLPLKEEPTP